MTDQRRTYTKCSILSRITAIAVAFALSTICCCSKSENGGVAGLEEFMERSDCGLYSHGGFLFRYNKVNCQLSINLMRKQIRMQSDDQTDYINMQFIMLPSPSVESTDVTLTYKLGNEEIVNSCNMEIVKLTGDKIWLWDKKGHLGIIIPAKWTGIQ